jgi:hypothetical protein
MISTMLNLLFGCRHKRITRPITPVHKPGTHPDDTYVACLECGRQFHYDATTMCLWKPGYGPLIPVKGTGRGPHTS